MPPTEQHAIDFVGLAPLDPVDDVVHIAPTGRYRQPGNWQCRSRRATARRSARLGSRLRRPRSSTSDFPRMITRPTAESHSKRSTAHLASGPWPRISERIANRSIGNRAPEPVRTGERVVVDDDVDRRRHQTDCAGVVGRRRRSTQHHQRVGVLVATRERGARTPSVGSGAPAHRAQRSTWRWPPDRGTHRSRHHRSWVTRGDCAVRSSRRHRCRASSSSASSRQRRATSTKSSGTNAPAALSNVSSCSA